MGTWTGTAGVAAGFGLIEVLVALVVLSAGLLGAAALSTAVERQRRLAARETGRTLVAQQVLDSLRQAGFAAARDGGTTLSLAGRRWPVSWSVEAVSSRLKAVEVRVEGRAGDAPLSFATRLHRPRVGRSDGTGGS